MAGILQLVIIWAVAHPATIAQSEVKFLLLVLARPFQKAESCCVSGV